MRSASSLLLATILLSSLLQTTGSGSQDKAATTAQAKQSNGPQPFRIFNPSTLSKPTSGYSQVAEVSGGKIVYIAGQAAVDRSGNLVGKDDFRAQVEQAFENLKAAVEAAGGDFNSVVKLNIFCTESVDSTAISVAREVRNKYVNTSSPPVSTFVVVKRLVRPEAMIEVEAVAVVNK